MVQHPECGRITIWSGIFSFVGTLTLILYDQGKHAAHADRAGRPTRLAKSARAGYLMSASSLPAGTWRSAVTRSVQTEWKWSTDLGGLVPMLQGKGHDGRLDWRRTSRRSRFRST